MRTAPKTTLPDPSMTVDNANFTNWPRPLVRQRADPWVWRHSDGYYYFTATVPAYDRIELRRAASLAGLATAETFTVWTKPAAGPMSYHVWAPELHHIDGRWFIYFAAGRADDIWAIRIYVLECLAPDPRLGTWIERGQLNTGLETFALDATTFAHRGIRYLAWAQHDPSFGGNTSLFLAPLADPTRLAGPAVCLSNPELPWETGGFKVNEGPAALIRHGRVHLAYSASATDARYCIGMLTADADSNLLDPASWRKSPVPVLATNETIQIFGPGHNCFTTLPDGRDIIVYHARDYRDIDGDPLENPDRHTRATLVHYDQAGLPRFTR